MALATERPESPGVQVGGDFQGEEETQHLPVKVGLHNLAGLQTQKDKGGHVACVTVPSTPGRTTTRRSP